MLSIFLAIIGVFYGIYRAYWPWFKPKEWRKRTNRYRRKAQKNLPFLPETVLYRYLNKHPDFDLWYARLGYLLMIVLFIAIIIVLYWNLTVEL